MEPKHLKQAHELFCKWFNTEPKEVHIFKFPLDIPDIKHLVVMLGNNISGMMGVTIEADICLIVVDEGYIQDIPKEYFAATLSHELGHVILGHIEENSYSQQNEIEADRYAASIHGADVMIDTLMYVWSKAKNPRYITIERMISERITALEEYI